MAETIRRGAFDDYQSPEYSNVKFLSQHGNEVLVPHDGWAEAMLGRDAQVLGERRVVGL